MHGDDPNLLALPDFGETSDLTPFYPVAAERLEPLMRERQQTWPLKSTWSSSGAQPEGHLVNHGRVEAIRFGTLGE